ncbi:hypothetical protein GCM10010123_29800 [Pilimelia anulata]|uniref:Uncharacterized protein n=1 Tax=Pilimelia anulata TaxID=53371 RepID=A0A8J3F9Q2_9ACTN|nr:hypothetical protein [Pilimelia anulata]GGJ97763.1 hypothetical protein GCM10010123_29800 [Pilimelia anulata]
MSTTDPGAASVAPHRRRAPRRLLFGTAAIAVGAAAALALVVPGNPPTADAGTLPGYPVAPTVPADDPAPYQHACTADDALVGPAVRAHLGRSLTEVRTELGGALLRVIGQDGRCAPLTRDYNPARTNVYLERGVVVRATMG